jgi:hypothetical protein
MAREILSNFPGGTTSKNIKLFPINSETNQGIDEDVSEDG